MPLQSSASASRAQKALLHWSMPGQGGTGKWTARTMSRVSWLRCSKPNQGRERSDPRDGRGSESFGRPFRLSANRLRKHILLPFGSERWPCSALLAGVVGQREVFELLGHLSPLKMCWARRYFSRSLDASPGGRSRRRHYTQERPHRGLGLAMPAGDRTRARRTARTGVERRDVLGGLIHEYRWVA
jgi:hypothetical protein